VHAVSTAPLADVVGWQCLAGHPDQYWGWVKSSADPSYYYLYNLNSGQVLGVNGNSTAVGASVVQYPNVNLPDNQLWEPEPASAIPTAPQTGQLAGYSAYPANAAVTAADATWKVPTISCKTGTSGERVAVWAGMMGSETARAEGLAWLPQIGTVSQCYNGQPYYFLIWEMASMVSGGDNAAQDVYASVPNYTVTGDLPTVENPLSVFYGNVLVNAGDLVDAEVTAMSPSTSGAFQRTYEIQLEDFTTEQEAYGTISTNQAVSLENIQNQGAAVIEDDPSSGLAQFSPLTISAEVYGGSGSYGFFKWAMQLGSDQLASVSPLQITYNQPGAQVNYDYTVTWQHVT